MNTPGLLDRIKLPLAPRTRSKRATCWGLGVASVLWAAPLLVQAGTPKVGDKAPAITLKALDDQTVRLNELTASGSVVVVVLRGWPGYQCPVCDRQTQDFIRSAPEFEEADARVLFVYPGPAEGLKAHAKEFQSWKGKEWPKEFIYALDPDYNMVDAYGLRWNAPQETAYPSTFVLDTGGIIRFAKISRGHGDRTTAAETLAAVKDLPGK